MAKDKKENCRGLCIHHDNNRVCCECDEVGDCDKACSYECHEPDIYKVYDTID